VAGAARLRSKALWKRIFCGAAGAETGRRAGTGALIQQGNFHDVSRETFPVQGKLVFSWFSENEWLQRWHRIGRGAGCFRNFPVSAIKR
jgi:hypothetical protein